MIIKLDINLAFFTIICSLRKSINLYLGYILVIITKVLYWQFLGSYCFFYYYSIISAGFYEESLWLRSNKFIVIKLFWRKNIKAGTKFPAYMNFFNISRVPQNSWYFLIIFPDFYYKTFYLPGNCFAINIKSFATDLSSFIMIFLPLFSTNSSVTAALSSAPSKSSGLSNPYLTL